MCVRVSSKEVYIYIWHTDSAMNQNDIRSCQYRGRVNYINLIFFCFHRIAFSRRGRACSETNGESDRISSAKSTTVVDTLSTNRLLCYKNAGIIITARLYYITFTAMCYDLSIKHIIVYRSVFYSRSFREFHRVHSCYKKNIKIKLNELYTSGPVIL